MNRQRFKPIDPVPKNKATIGTRQMQCLLRRSPPTPPLILKLSIPSPLNALGEASMNDEPHAGHVDTHAYVTQRRTIAPRH